VQTQSGWGSHGRGLLNPLRRLFLKQILKFCFVRFLTGFFRNRQLLVWGLLCLGYFCTANPGFLWLRFFLQDARLLDWLATKPGFLLKRCRRARRQRSYRRARATVIRDFRQNFLFSQSRLFRMAGRLLRLRRVYQNSQPLALSARTFYQFRGLTIRSPLSYFRRRTRPYQTFLATRLAELKQARFLRRRRWFRRMRATRSVRRYMALRSLVGVRNFRLLLRRQTPLRLRRLLPGRRKVRPRNFRRHNRFRRFAPARIRSRAFFRAPTILFNRRFFFRFVKSCRFRGCIFAARVAGFLLYRAFGVPVRIRLNFCGYVGTSDFHLNYITTKLYYRYILNDVIKPIIRLSRVHYRGFRLVCRGRFTRAQMATERVYRFGSVRASSLHIPVDYAQRFVVLKYGVCNLKIWLRY
jgi:hypothetical protein